MRPISRLLLLTLFALAPQAALTVAARAAEPTGASPTYSVLTYNIGGKPGFLGYALDNGSSCEERARQIAEHVLALDPQPDIVVFAEATGDCYKDQLQQVLATDGPYKSFIHQMHDGTARLQDSGLMFFSKFPWTLPHVHDGCAAPVLTDGTVPSTSAPVFGEADGDFMVYSDLAFDDRYMAKGVGYACVTNPATAQAVNVFFTHNQANYWTPLGDDLDDFAHEEREVNMKEAAAYVELMAPSWKTAKTGQAVIFAGDMNTIGDDVAYWLNARDGVLHADGREEIEAVYRPADVDGFQEYADLIGPAGILAGVAGLRDPWRTDGTRAPQLAEFDKWGDRPDDMGYVYDPSAIDDVDMGFTWDAVRNGQTDGDRFRVRLDYILDRQVRFNDEEDCYQHMTVERGFTYTDTRDVEPAYVGMDLSDHYPLRAVIGPHEAQCSPSLAPHDVLGAQPVTVAHGGAHKWFFYSQPGTYVFDAGTSADLQLEVYAASDLSTPLVPREGDPAGAIGPGSVVEGRANHPVTYKLDHPFYVLVRFKDRSHVGSFTFKAHKNTCATWAEAAWLDPFDAAAGTLAAIPTAQPRCYFKILQDQELSPGTAVEVQALAAHLTNADGTAGAASLALYAHDAPTYATPAPLTMSGPDVGQVALADKLAADPAYRYLVLDRGAGNQEMSFDIVWTRNITTVDIQRFTVVNQDDSNGGDEIAIFWSIEDHAADVCPVDPDAHTANGQAAAEAIFYYDGLASGASSSTPLVLPMTPTTSFADPHHVRLAYPDALWGLSWEIDDTSPDDLLIYDGLLDGDGRYRIDALDPDPRHWIDGGALAPAQVYDKDLFYYEAAWPTSWERGYHLRAKRNLGP